MMHHLEDRYGEISDAPRFIDDYHYILSQRDVEDATTMGRTALKNVMETDATFPKPVVVSPRHTGWYLGEIREWLKNRPRRGNYTASAQRM